MGIGEAKVDGVAEPGNGFFIPGVYKEFGVWCEFETEDVNVFATSPEVGWGAGELGGGFGGACRVGACVAESGQVAGSFGKFPCGVVFGTSNEADDLDDKDSIITNVELYKKARGSLIHKNSPLP